MKNFKWMRSGALLSFALLFGLMACDSGQGGSDQQFSIDYEKYVLPNGLEVVLHQDKSDPIVAVAVSVHVGSNRERPGRTGFAHFFEHMLFQKSEHLPERAFFTKIGDLGGTFNGFTNTDNTVYYEVVPNDALEKVLWMESDRMGYFINAISVADMENEKGVVQNEKRQRYDNAPYGLQREAINKALYPSDHPYNWLTIGELEDLQNATLEDVQEFYEKWYGPNNATLVIAGDFDVEETKAWVEKYFGEIESRGTPEALKPMPVTLNETKVLYYEDNFARLPRLTLTYPTVAEFHEDEAALDALGQILAVGKRAPMYKVIVDQESMASDNNVYAYNSSSELAGTFTINVTANAGEDLDSVKMAVDAALNKFETEGFDDKDLERIKISLETDFYNGISSVLSKAFQLARYNEFAGDPGYIEKAVASIQAVTKEDVMRVYRKYIKDQNYVLTAWVPKGQMDLSVEGAAMAEVVEEDINDAYTTPETIDMGETPMVKSETAFDRTIEPELGNDPLLTPPTIYQGSLSNGMKVWGIEQSELPLVSFSITLKGGLLADNPDNIGAANLITDVMMEGTANKTPEELEDAIGQLGLNLGMYTSDESITISANCLSRNFDSALALVEEILLQPRWDEAEFTRLKNETLTSIRARESNPNALANLVMRKKLYGDGHILSNPTSGYAESVGTLTIEDLKAYYNANFSPKVANFHVAGDISKADVMEKLKSLEANWAAKEVSFPNYVVAPTPEEPQVYFVDVPNAKQSVIQISRMLPEADTDEEYYKMVIANERLGGGSSGILFRVLREEKKYTYGAYSYISRDRTAPASFTAASSVQSNVTADALDVFKEIISGYDEEYTEEMLEATRNKTIRSNTRQYETLGSLLGILQQVSAYDLPTDFVDRQQQIVKNITVEEVKQIINDNFDMNRMIYVIVGDAATQLESLKVDGAGNPIVVDAMGEPVGAM